MVRWAETTWAILSVIAKDLQCVISGTIMRALSANSLIHQSRPIDNHGEARYFKAFEEILTYIFGESLGVRTGSVVGFMTALLLNDRTRISF